MTIKIGSKVRVIGRSLCTPRKGEEGNLIDIWSDANDYPYRVEFPDGQKVGFLRKELSGRLRKGGTAMTWINNEDELDAEDLADEVSLKETLKAIEVQAQRYKSLFGELPSGDLTPAEVQDRIVREMARRDLRPYKL